MQCILCDTLLHTKCKATALKENENGKIHCYKQTIQETRKRLSLRRVQDQHRKQVQREEIHKTLRLHELQITRFLKKPTQASVFLFCGQIEPFKYANKIPFYLAQDEFQSVRDKVIRQFYKVFID